MQIKTILFQLMPYLIWTSLSALFPTFAIAQIIPDDTLGDRGSTVTPNVEIDGTLADIINGGAERGNNLFHSFAEFNIDANQAAYFVNPAGIDRIFSRVTGANPSHILGKLGVFGNADLFLLNPNGILFGDRASLDVGGSVVATTAHRVRFADGSHFGMPDGPPPSLLTVSAPVGLQLDDPSSSVTVRGTGYALEKRSEALLPRSRAEIADATVAWNQAIDRVLDRPAGLSVPEGETLALVGGSLTLDGANLTAPDGTIDLAAIASGDWSLDEGQPVGTVRRGNLSVGGQASIDVSGTGGGAIRLVGDRVSVTGNSTLTAITQGHRDGRGITIDGNRIEVSQRGWIGTASVASGRSGAVTVSGDRLSIGGTSLVGTLALSQGDAGNVSVRTTEAIEIADNSLLTANSLDASGNGGALQLLTRRLHILGGARLSASSFGAGKGGNLRVSASESVEVLGTSADGEDESAIAARTFASGDAGSLTIDTARLLVSDGGQISTSTFDGGEGGVLTVNASDRVEAIGKAEIRRSGLFASVGVEATGNGGNLTINTARLSVRDGAWIGASTSRFSSGRGGTVTVNASEFVELLGTDAGGIPTLLFAETLGSGSAGNINLNTARLFVRDGAQVSASTLDEGAGGTLTVNASERVEISGTALVSSEAELVNPIIPTEGELDGDAILRSGLFAASGIEGVFGGRGTGAGGDARITTEELVVREGGVVAVSSLNAGDAGNLRIAADRVRLDLGSLAAATPLDEGGNIELRADTLTLRNRSAISASAGGMGSGGNLNFDVGAIALLENSQIAADAIEGPGGNIAIATSGLFRSDNSRIAATSQLGIDGAVSISTPDVQLSNNLTPLALEFVSAEQVVADSCLDRDGNSGSNRFTISGTGGLPTTPYEAVPGYFQLSDVRSLPRDNPPTPRTSVPPPQGWQVGDPIREAETLQVEENGDIALIETVPSSPSMGNASESICPGSQH
jgi:filamentous hemagglutinin family protein